ncbi:FAD-binding protein [Ensifer sp. Root558]|uniref:FAD-binding protein n=1 Tax=Ensifer sp. Root558 TaxID=1736558 RepID=UPI000AB99FF1|nr:FAD-binding protein [Ensifer sp. Root558]
MRLMRRRVRNAGITILDHHPATQLLTLEGRVVGASGLRRQAGGHWVVNAGAVVLAGGGCAFMSKALGCDVLTGDGYLMGAEVGAELSGMEFSSAYAISPAFASITKTALYRFAQFYRKDHSLIEGAGSARGRSIIARTLLSEPVFARLDLAGTDEVKAILRRAQPNFFVPFDRRGINPFTDFFEVKLRLEGTVRGTGGLRLTGLDCSGALRRWRQRHPRADLRRVHRRWQPQRGLGDRHRCLCWRGCRVLFIAAGKRYRFRPGMHRAL